MKKNIFILLLATFALLLIGGNAGAQTSTQPGAIHHDDDNDNCQKKVTAFTLVNSENEHDIGTLHNGDEISSDCDLNIRAEVQCGNKIESVEFKLNGHRVRIENDAPYALAGDHNGDYAELNLSPGNYQLKAIPWSGNNATGSQGTSLTISFTVTDDKCGGNDEVNNCCDFRSDMRKLWIDHIVWTRNVIFNIIDDLPGTNEAVARLLQNQVDIGNLFGNYYGSTNGNKLAGYLHNHITIAAEILVAVKTNDTASFNNANTRWYLNADTIIAFLHSINPHWSTADLHHHMYEHLEYTTDEVVARATADYPGDVENFEEVITSVLEMADFFTDGIMEQFPDRFTCEDSGGHPDSGNDESDNHKTSGQNIQLTNGNILLEQNVPNPFADKTTIGYFIPETVKEASIVFYDSKGALIKTVDVTGKGAGSLSISPLGLSEGIYSYSIVADGKVIETKKMIHQN